VNLNFITEMPPSTFTGLRIVETEMLTEPGEPIDVRRTWRERLFSRPWRPLRATKLFVPQVPMKTAMRVGNTLYMHPVTARAMRQMLKENR
jgi:hypothetical protein